MCLFGPVRLAHSTAFLSLPMRPPVYPPTYVWLGSEPPFSYRPFPPIHRVKCDYTWPLFSFSLFIPFSDKRRGIPSHCILPSNKREGVTASAAYLTNKYYCTYQTLLKILGNPSFSFTYSTPSLIDSSPCYLTCPPHSYFNIHLSNIFYYRELTNLNLRTLLTMTFGINTNLRYTIFSDSIS